MYSLNLPPSFQWWVVAVIFDGHFDPLQIHIYRRRMTQLCYASASCVNSWRCTARAYAFTHVRWSTQRAKVNPLLVSSNIQQHYKKLFLEDCIAFHSGPSHRRLGYLFVPGNSVPNNSLLAQSRFLLVLVSYNNKKWWCVLVNVFIAFHSGPSHSRLWYLIFPGN
jgi:hypothetical protein